MWRFTVVWRLMGSAVLVIFLAACSAEIGSDRWCNAMKKKDKGEWTANEAVDFAKHCIVK